MKFYLQQGHGMMGLNREFTEKNPGSGVILSPRNCKQSQIEKHARELHKINTNVLFDPQFYEPRTERENIINFPYWDGLEFSTSDFATSGATELCEGVVNYQVNTLNTNSVILPGRYTNAISDEWLNNQFTLSNIAAEMKIDREIYSTLALGPDVICQRESLDRVLNEVVEYPVDGVYVVLKKPEGKFLVDNEVYIYNLLDSFLSIALSGKKIMLGYANQQDLIYASTGVTILASGNFRNVRSFNPELFDVQDEKGVMQRAIWYYDANTLSEFRVETLSLAYQRGLKGEFGPSCEYCNDMLSSTNPATIPWGEPMAFRHYLTEMNRQWRNIESIPINQRINNIISILENSQQKLLNLIDRGFRPGERSFNSSFEPTLNALYAIRADRQFDISNLSD